MNRADLFLIVRQNFDTPCHEHGCAPCSVCMVNTIEVAVSEEREACAKLADAKAREHIELAQHFTKRKDHASARVHERYAMVCNGSDGIASRIRSRE